MANQIIYVAVSNDEYELPVAYGRTYRELAKRLGVSVSYVNKGLHGAKGYGTRMKYKFIKMEMDNFNQNIMELLSLHSNYLRSNYIKKYTVKELEGALIRLEHSPDKSRYKYISEELERRAEKEQYNVMNKRSKGFTDTEWEEFSREWRKACEEIRASKSEKIVIDIKRRKQ